MALKEFGIARIRPLDLLKDQTGLDADMVGQFERQIRLDIRIGQPALVIAIGGIGQLALDLDRDIGVKFGVEAAARII